MRDQDFQQAIADFDPSGDGPPLSLRAGRNSPNNLYELALRQVEQPLFEAILEHTKGNQSRAAELLGLNRGTLRKKLRSYNLHK